MRIIKALAALLIGTVVAACGGGGGSAGTAPFGSGGAGGGGGGGGGAGTPAQPTLALALSSPTVTAATPATVTATVRDGNGNAVPGQVVGFSTTASLGTFNVASALTDAAGQAVVALFPAAGATSGADEVVASTNVNGSALTAQQGFQLTATNVSISSFTSDLGAASLSAYGQTNLTVAVAGAAQGTPVTVTLGSVCVSKTKATLTPASVTTTSGSATFTYKDQGCGATDAVDPLQASLSGTTAAANLNLSLTSPAASSTTFVASSPETIYLKGSGFTESSTVTFQVRDVAGNPLPNQSVTLTATTLAGGLTIDGGTTPVTKPSDSNGNVSALINSGTVPTPVRVQATLTGTSITTVSSTLAIAVGLPSQLNFSLSQTTRNIEGFNIDGTPNGYQIIASDRLGNPVPAGTAINFVTEGGQVEAIKQIQSAAGIARTTANFVSASPRPADGRITVVAYALGEESFIDTNGNNIFDSGEAFQDLGDVFIDRAFNGTYEQASDQFISLSVSGTAGCAAVTNSLLVFDPSIPSVGGQTCDGAWGRAYVRRATETVLATSSARPLWLGKPPALDGSCLAIPIVDNANGSSSPYFVVGAGGLQNAGISGTFSIIVADANPNRLNPMAAGTTISASTPTDGLTLSVLGGSPVPSTLSASTASISYEFEPGTATAGTAVLNFTSPSGLTTTVSFPINSAATSVCPP